MTIILVWQRSNKRHFNTVCATHLNTLTQLLFEGYVRLVQSRWRANKRIFNTVYAKHLGFEHFITFNMFLCNTSVMNGFIWVKLFIRFCWCVLNEFIWRYVVHADHPSKTFDAFIHLYLNWNRYGCIFYLTPKHLETRGCAPSTVTTDVPVLKRQATNNHSVDKIFIVSGSVSYHNTTAVMKNIRK